VLSRLFYKTSIKCWRFFIQQDIKKLFLIALEHKFQMDYHQNLKKSENGNRISLITIPIDIGEKTFTTLCLLEHRGSVQQSFIHHPSMSTNT